MQIDESRVERFAKRRTTASLLFALVAMLMTLSLAIRVDEGTVNRPGVIGWLGWQAVPLIWLYVGPGRLRWLGLSRFSEGDIAVLNDELVQANRLIAAQAGFAVLLVGATILALGALGLLALPRWAALVELDAGVAGAAITFAIREFRSQSA